MQSEFYYVALDRIRYSLVWEASSTLYAGLEIAPRDRVLVITSAGCNVLNALLKKPAQVVAIDLNPVQNKLLELKKHIILQHPHRVFRGLLGLNGAGEVEKAWQQVQQSLPAAEQGFWLSFFSQHPNGILPAGKLETYLNGFYHTLDSGIQEKLKALLSFEKVAEQQDFFLRELHPTAFRSQFIEYFDEQNLSKGRDPKLFRYAVESGGESFYFRLMQQLSTVPVKHNFFFRFFFFGPEGLPEAILPPCYQSQNYSLLRSQLEKLQIEEGEAVDFLLSPKGAVINKASLSNIFEYTSTEEFAGVCQALFNASSRSLRVLFWNLLQDQGSGSLYAQEERAALAEQLSASEACFYFRNVRVMEPVAVPVPG